MKVLLDSNVIVPGIAFQGNERVLLLATFAPTHEYIISEGVRDEVSEFLREKFPTLPSEAEEIQLLIRAETIPREAYKSQLRDFPGLIGPKDAHILAAAVATHCDLIVTGDKDLFDMEALEGIATMKPSEALRILGINKANRTA